TRRKRVHGDPPDAEGVSHPLGTDFFGRLRRGGGRGLLAGTDLPRAFRWSRCHQRMATGRPPTAGPLESVPRLSRAGGPWRLEFPDASAPSSTRRNDHAGWRPARRLSVLPELSSAHSADARRRRQLADRSLHGRRQGLNESLRLTPKRGRFAIFW